MKGNNKGQCFLDVGCGVGSSLDIYDSLKDVDITGVDINKEAIEIMKRRYPKANFLVADAHKLPFRENSFDRVYCGHILEHVDRPDLVLNEARRVLKPSGILVIAVPHPKFEALAKRILPYWHGKNMHKRIFNENDLINLLKTVNVKPIKITSRRWLLGATLNFWYAIIRLFHLRIEPHTGLLIIKGAEPKKGLIVRSLGREFFRWLRRTADLFDRLPLINQINRFYAQEIYLISKKEP